MLNVYQIFGKKSIEQLLFEKKQSMIGEQDKLVQDYLEDMQQKNDKLTPSYHKLKNELNIFRYWRVLCAYDKVIFMPPDLKKLKGD